MTRQESFMSPRVVLCVFVVAVVVFFAGLSNSIAANVQVVTGEFDAIAALGWTEDLVYRRSTRMNLERVGENGEEDNGQPSDGDKHTRRRIHCDDVVAKAAAELEVAQHSHGNVNGGGSSYTVADGRFGSVEVHEWV